MKKLFTALLLICGFAAHAAEVIPPTPKLYFNDYAKVVSSATAERLNQRLEDFERETSSQIVVAIFPKMQSDSSIEDYTVRVVQSWKVGQKEKNNGAVLFVFDQDRKMFLQVGYGLEGALPDALCKRIIEEEIKPHFKASDFDGGLTAGVKAILAATRGEYKGTGRTVADSSIFKSSDIPWPVVMVVIFLVLILILVVRGMFRGSHQRYYGSYGWGSSSSWSGGSWSGGGGGGGFSGGGGSFGGGGAGGSW